MITENFIAEYYKLSTFINSDSFEQMSISFWSKDYKNPCLSEDRIKWFKMKIWGLLTHEICGQGKSNSIEANGRLFSWAFYEEKKILFRQSDSDTEIVIPRTNIYSYKLVYDFLKSKDFQNLLDSLSIQAVEICIIKCPVIE
jgi:hypothetical protein